MCMWIQTFDVGVLTSFLQCGRSVADLPHEAKCCVCRFAASGGM